MFAGEALYYCLGLNCESVLDIGSGSGYHARRFREAGRTVTTLDHSTHLGKPDVLGDFLQTTVGKFDLIWASHVLEHQRNPGLFLEKVRDCCIPGGYIAITVPPAKHEIVGGHVTLWNAGLLAYNMVLAGINCRKANIWSYGYNISCVVRYHGPITLPELVMDAGDLEKLQDYFPRRLTQNTNGSW